MQGALTDDDQAAFARESAEAEKRIRERTVALNKKLALQASYRDDYERSVRYARCRAKSKAQKKARKIQRRAK